MMPQRIRRTLWLVVWVAFAGVPCLNAAPEAGYTSLFNGRDLTGWTPMGPPEAFTVQDNAIYTTGARPYPSWLRSTTAYENFVLRFEYQTEGWYEGGVLWHAPPEGPGSKLGFKIHLRHDRKAYGMRSPGAIYDAAAPMSIANLPSGQWNQCEIECLWPRLRVTLNGERIHDIAMDREEAFKNKLRRGFVGIQNLGCRASFRNIRIRVLPDQEQWTSLFAGGMEGLVTQGHSQWRIQDDVLTGQGDDGAAFTREAFADPFELQVWVKTAVNGNGGVLFHAGPGRVEVQCFNAPDSTNPTGSLYGIVPAGRVLSRDQEWFLLQIFSHGPQARVRVNGEEVSATDALKPPYRGPIGFQQHTPGGTIHYRGARIKSLESDRPFKN
jgi:hypothetical protein